MPLLLGLWRGLGLSLLFMFGLVLHAELAGYEQQVERVRCRLVPLLG